jgi:6-phosphofructo-2-kinase/fructose-2,6-biphosphatase 2
MELERSENVLIITHQAVLRCIYAYFMNLDQSRSPWLAVPLHTLIRLTPRAYGTQENKMASGIDKVSTWRGKGSVAQHEDAPEDVETLGGK